MPGALDGLKVLDLSSLLSGPYCGLLLGDHGADVIKIGRRGEGDDARSMSPHVGGEGAPFMLWNRTKRSIQLDLKAEDARHSFLALVDGADILIENFRPGTVDRLALGAANDTLISLHKMSWPNSSTTPASKKPSAAKSCITKVECKRASYNKGSM